MKNLLHLSSAMLLQLIAKYQNKNRKKAEAAFKLLFKRYHDVVYLIVLGVLRECIDHEKKAEEITSDTMYKFWILAKKWSEKNPPIRSILGWIVMIGKNSAIEYLRKEKNIQWESIDCETMSTTEPETEIFYDLTPKLAYIFHPLTNLDMIPMCHENDLLPRVLLRYVRKLKNPDHSLILLGKLRGKCPEAIGEQLGRNRNWVDRRWHELKKELKILLHQDGLFPLHKLAC